jgi:phosphatidylglycerophosphatase A
MKTVATLGPLGFGIAPGTLATLVTVPFVIARAVYLPLSAEQELWVLSILCILGWFVIDQALVFFPREPDPSAIVFDEVVGIFVAFYAIPINWQTVVLGTLLFRFFDITKPYVIRRCESLIGALGVLADDVAAGIATALVIHGLYRIGLLS